MSVKVTNSNCAVLGAGTMGAQIALSMALGGTYVTLWGRREETLEPAFERCTAGLDFLASQGLVNAEDCDAVLSRIDVSSDLGQAVAGKGFVIESIVENMALKQDLLANAEAETVDGTILSSTTSALSATALQSALKAPQNFCIAHYAQPAHLMELVEVVPGEKSSNYAVTATTLILTKIGKKPVLCPDIPGFLWARIQHAVLREFSSLVGQGLVTPEACDKILKLGYASRLPAMGAFEHADLAGLDLINSDAAKTVWADLSNVTDPADTPVGALLAEGKLGMKSGQGFYDWNERDPVEFKRLRDEEIIRRVKINRDIGIS